MCYSIAFDNPISRLYNLDVRIAAVALSCSFPWQICAKDIFKSYPVDVPVIAN